MESNPITGGCQCGAVRYEINLRQLEKVHLCHCRMCQRATGNLFAALAGTPKDRIRWIGTPTLFASSSVADRGFCARCGTPLSFAYHQSERIYVTIGSLDHPEQVQPEIHFGIESQLPWLHIADDCPRERTLASPMLRHMVSHQPALPVSGD